MSFVETNKSIDALLEELDIEIEDVQIDDMYDDNFYDDDMESYNNFDSSLY